MRSLEILVYVQIADERGKPTGFCVEAGSFKSLVPGSEEKIRAGLNTLVVKMLGVDLIESFNVNAFNTQPIYRLFDKNDEEIDLSEAEYAAKMRIVYTSR